MKKSYALVALLTISLMLGSCGSQAKTTQSSSVTSKTNKVAKQSRSSSSTTTKKTQKHSTQNIAVKTRDKEKIAVMLFQMCYPDDDIMQEINFGIWQNDGGNFVGNGGPACIVSYQIEGNNVKYSRKANKHYPPFKTISLAELEQRYYSTPAQVKQVDDIIVKIHQGQKSPQSFDSTHGKVHLTTDAEAIAYATKKQGDQGWTVHVKNVEGNNTYWSLDNADGKNIGLKSDGTFASDTDGDGSYNVPAGW
ncbi:hypothetical protein FFY61_06225 [Pediococcus acidilactici]|uniref:Lreu-0056-like domain-containing protein n=1 Tax=Pediococcus acidilactici TaxID=1254 RepID=A0AAW8YF85_PEDAC|nr:hypothetical protein [Pediococcus acidilactici]KRN91455.1 hypothetical protein IV82_GL000799 [Pediococcus acidilactici]MDD9322560.1 hypothetical protein [Pediococcus acidilactici]MDV2621140.1 hypothetical protein [Pediococcus acidilactici]NBI15369.1 hypothetical protein [Pediococcus acidilactici]NFA45858.1 hypothetical protein [Pediococcus acidilactici]